MTRHLTSVEYVIQQAKGRPPWLLFVLAGPSGVGKNTIIKKLLASYADEMDRIRTYTTRKKRDDEAQGDQYHFVSREEFRELALAGKLMEANAQTVGHDVYKSGDLYSMPADPLAGLDPQKHLAIAEVDIHGMRLLKERYPDCITIFDTAPPLALIQRIRTRGAMDVDTLALRMAAAREHIRGAREFQYIVFNERDRLDDAVVAIKKIIEAERMRVRDGFDLEVILPEDAFTLLEEDP